MTNKLAIFILLLIAAGLAADYYYADWTNITFLLQKFLDMIEWLIFWR